MTNIVAFPTDKKYSIIACDPPWAYDDKLTGGKVWGSVENHYSAMEHEDMLKLPVKEIAEKDCIMFMWITWPKLKEALEVMEAWGFTYRTAAFVWVKTFNGRVHRGMGRWTRSNSEVVLLGKRGKPQRLSAKVSQIIRTIDDGDWTPETVTAELKGHSVKPDIFRKKIVQLVGDLPRIELFARTKIHGWDTWGNDEKLNAKPLEEFF